MELIQHIDAICRKLGHDVLFIEFHPEQREQQRRYEFMFDGQRADLLRQLDQLGIGYWPCGPVANPLRMESYRGQMYVEVPCDPDAPAYQAICRLLGPPGGESGFDNVRFKRLSLDTALLNSAHDEPGFWERWAEGF